MSLYAFRSRLAKEAVKIPAAVLLFHINEGLYVPLCIWEATAQNVGEDPGCCTFISNGFLKMQNFQPVFIEWVSQQNYSEKHKKRLINYGRKLGT